MKFSNVFVGAFICLAMLAGTVQAAPITIDDHSFEGLSSGDLGAWNEVGPSAVLVATGSAGGSPKPTPPDGTNWMVVNGGSIGNGINQTLSHQILDNTIYTLTFTIGVRDDLATKDFAVVLYGGSITGANELERVTQDALTTLDFDGTPPSSSGTEELTLIWDSTGSSLVGTNLVVRAVQTESGAGQTFFDNFQLDASPVPEPGSLALLGLGGLCMLVRCRKA